MPTSSRSNRSTCSTIRSTPRPRQSASNSSCAAVRACTASNKNEAELIAAAADHERDILAAEAEAVGKSVVQRRFAGRIRDIVQIEVRQIGILVIDRRRQDFVA